MLHPKEFPVELGGVTLTSLRDEGVDPFGVRRWSLRIGNRHPNRTTFTSAQLISQSKFRDELLRSRRISMTPVSPSEWMLGLQYLKNHQISPKEQSNETNTSTAIGR